MNGFWQRLRYVANKRWGMNTLVFVLFALAVHLWNHPKNLQVRITATIPTGAKSTLYYAKAKQAFSDAHSIQKINSKSTETTQTFTVMAWSQTRELRWDPMQFPGRLSIQQVSVRNEANQWLIQSQDIRNATHSTNQVAWIDQSKAGQIVDAMGIDPFFVWRLPNSLQTIPASTWLKHVLSTLVIAGLLTGFFVMVRHGLTLQVRQKGRAWLLRGTLTALGLSCLIWSSAQLALQHHWWTWELVLKANERDGLRHALPPVIKDAQVLLQRIDPQTPVALSSTWKADTFSHYAAEEYLYPVRFIEQANLQLSTKGSRVDPKCQTVHEHGNAVLLECHD